MLKAIVLCVGLSIVTMLAIGCKDEPVAEPEIDYAVANRDSILSYLEANNLLDSTEEHSSGIFYQVINSSTDVQVNSGDVVSIFYEANALGEQLFARVGRAQGDDSVKLQYGTNSVFPVGLETGLGLMRRGETFLFYIPAALAYGDMEDLSTIIPPHSVIVLRVEIVNVQSTTQILEEQMMAIDTLISREKLDSLPAHPVDSFFVTSDSLYYKRTALGTPGTYPNSGQTVGIRYQAFKLSAYPDGTAFDAVSGSAVFDFIYGQNQVFQGLDLGIGLMERTEQATLIIPSHLAYGASAFVIAPPDRLDYLVDQNVIPQYAARVSPYEVLVFEVELLDNPPAP